MDFLHPVKVGGGGKGGGCSPYFSGFSHFSAFSSRSLLSACFLFPFFSSFFFQMEGFLCNGKWLTDPSAASNPTIPRSTGCNRCKAAGRAWKLFCTLRVLYNPFSHQAGTEFWCEGLCLVRATVLGKEIFFVTRKGSFWCCFGGFSFFL